MGGVASGIGNAIGGSVGGFIKKGSENIFGRPAEVWQPPGAGPRPDRPEFRSIEGPGGSLTGGFYSQGGPPIASTMDRRGMNQFREEALGAPGTSQWEALSRQNLSNAQTAARTRLAEDQASQQATARSQLAMRGGISGGARERMAKAGTRDAYRGQQDLAQQGITEGGNIGLKAEEMRKQQLAALPGMEVAQLEPQFKERTLNQQNEQFNVSNALAEKRAKDASDMAAYLAQMKDWAAAQQAGAISNSGAKDRGGLLGGLGK